jgi:LPXTG-motif cell wall-anchored protein
LILAAGLILTNRAKADDWDKKTVLTVNSPIQISDAYLDPGTYVLKLDRSPSDRHIVRIYNEKENHLIDTILSMPAYRVRPTGNTVFTFWETPPGTPRAMRDWYWPGDNFGQEFPYPKHLKEVALATPAPAPPAPPQVEQPAPQAQVEVQQQEEIAQNTPPPAPEAAPAPVPEQPQPEAAQPEATQPEPAPEELPKTATDYPLIGLLGVLSLGLYGLLRTRRSA